MPEGRNPRTSQTSTAVRTPRVQSTSHGRSPSTGFPVPPPNGGRLPPWRWGKGARGRKIVGATDWWVSTTFCVRRHLVHLLVPVLKLKYLQNKALKLNFWIEFDRSLKHFNWSILLGTQVYLLFIFLIVLSVVLWCGSCVISNHQYSEKLSF